MACTRTLPFLCLFMVTTALDPLQAVTTKSAYVTEVLDNLLKNGYDRRVRPNYGGAAVEVGITMYALSMSIDDQKMTMTADLYYREKWTDERLAFTPRHGMEVITAGQEVALQIWTPDTFFPHALKSSKHDVMALNTFVKISSSGQILMSTRISLTTRCTMNLRPFPMDSQICIFDIESYGHTSKDVRFKWANGYQSFGYAAEPEAFHFMGNKLKGMEIQLSSGNYSRLQVNLGFTRAQMGYYLLRAYLPAVFTVVVSWASFFLHLRAVPARIFLAGIAFLGEVVLSLSITTVLPAVPVIKSVEIYLFACLFMTFAVALEHVIALLFAKHSEGKSSDESDTTYSNADEKFMNKDGDGPSLSTVLFRAAQKLSGIRPETIDVISRIAFPIIFACFNLAYWIGEKYNNDWSSFVTSF